MGTAMPFITAAMSVASTAESIASAGSQRKAQARQIAHQQQQATLQQRLKERQMQRQLDSQKATARARMGASGTGSAGGSGAAVLRGLQSDFNQQINDSRALFNSNMAGSNLLDDRSAFGNALDIGKQLLGTGQQVVGVFEDSKEEQKRKQKKVPPGVFDL